MEKINPDFNIPFYLFEEITEYIEQTANGRCRSMKWENIKRLIRLAVVNGNLSEQQADFLVKNYSREEEKR